MTLRELKAVYLMHVRYSGNVDVPKSSTTIIWTLVVEWYMVRCGSKNGHQKDMGLEEIVCSKYTNYSRFYSQCNWEDLHDHFMSTRTFTSIINKIFIEFQKL